MTCWLQRQKQKKKQLSASGFLSCISKAKAPSLLRLAWMLLQLTMPVWKRTPGEENHTFAPSCLFPGSPLKISWEPFVKPFPKLGSTLPLSSWKHLRQACINKLSKSINKNGGALPSPCLRVLRIFIPSLYLTVKWKFFISRANFQLVFDFAQECTLWCWIQN